MVCGYYENTCNEETRRDNILKTNRENRPFINQQRKEKLFTLFRVESYEEFFTILDNAEITAVQPQLNGRCIWKSNIQCPIMLTNPKYKNIDNMESLAKNFCRLCELRKGISYSQATMTEQSAKEWVGEHFYQKEEKKYSTWQPKDSDLTQEQLEAMRCRTCKSQFFKIDELEQHERTCTGV